MPWPKRALSRAHRSVISEFHVSTGHPRRLIEGLSLWLPESCAGAGQSVPPLQLLATVCSFEPHLRPRGSIEGLSLFGCQSHARGPDNRCRRCNCWRRCVRWNRTCGLGDRSRVCPSLAARVMHGGRTIGAAVATAGDGVFVGTVPAASGIARGSVPLRLRESCTGAGQSVPPLQLLATVCSLEPHLRPRRSIEGLSLWLPESCAGAVQSVPPRQLLAMVCSLERNRSQSPHRTGSNRGPVTQARRPAPNAPAAPDGLAPSELKVRS
jgi:hypothetical protein